MSQKSFNRALAFAINPSSATKFNDAKVDSRNLRELQAKAESVSRLIQQVEHGPRMNRTVMINLSPKRKGTGKIEQPTGIPKEEKNEDNNID